MEGNTNGGKFSCVTEFKPDVTSLFVGTKINGTPSARHDACNTAAKRMRMR